MFVCLIHSWAKYATLESGIDVGERINVGPGKFGQKYKHGHQNFSLSDTLLVKIYCTSPCYTSCTQNIRHEKWVAQRPPGFENNFNGTKFHVIFMSKQELLKMLWTELYSDLSPDGGLELVFLLL